MGNNIEQQDFKRSMIKGRDEIYTPPILIYPVIKYLKTGSIIWCPFDTVSSEYVRILKGAGFKVIYSHLIYNQDFFTYTPEDDYDYIVSNPPFSEKLAVLKRLYYIDKPFMMLLGLPIVNYQNIGEFFFNIGSDIQLLIFDKKVSFDGNTSSFNTSYFCRGVLPRDILFEHLEHNNTNKNFVGSRMVLV